MLIGSLVAIVTPMHPDGRLDIERFKSLIDFHITEGTDGIVVVGTSGESPTVNFDEHKELIRIAVDVQDTEENREFFREFKLALEERFEQIVIYIRSYAVDIM